MHTAAELLTRMQELADTSHDAPGVFFYSLAANPSGARTKEVAFSNGTTVGRRDPSGQDRFGQTFHTVTAPKGTGLLGFLRQRPSVTISQGQSGELNIIACRYDLLRGRVVTSRNNRKALAIGRQVLTQMPQVA